MSLGAASRTRSPTREESGAMNCGSYQCTEKNVSVFRVSKH